MEGVIVFATFVAFVFTVGVVVGVFDLAAAEMIAIWMRTSPWVARLTRSIERFYYRGK